LIFEMRALPGELPSAYRRSRLRAINAAVDRELAVSIAVAQVLASSPRLAADDLKAFQDEAVAVLPWVFADWQACE
jgi:hypothetical protein